MNWIENFNSVTGVDDAAPQLWQAGDSIFDVYSVAKVRDGATDQIAFLHHLEGSMSMAVRSPRPEHFQTAEQQAHLLREVETCLRLGLNPFIVGCHFVLRLGSLPRLFFEWVNDGALEDWIHSGKLYEREEWEDEILSRIMRVAMRTAWGLHYGHTRGVIHQDVKPANVLMDSEFAKVANFGHAFIPSAAEIDPQTRVIADVQIPAERMTAAYCSPEQARGEKVSHRTDVWSWAVTVLEMFTGRRTWASGPLAATALEDFLRNSSDDHPMQMPEAFAQILRRCLADDPAARPPSLLSVTDEVEVSFPEWRDDWLLSPFVTLERPPPAVLNNRALSYFSLGRIDEAKAAWEESLKFDPLHYETVFNSGLLRWRSGEIDDEEFLARLKEVASASTISVPDFWGSDYGLYLVALAHFERGDWVAADRDMENVFKEDRRRERISNISI